MTVSISERSSVRPFARQHYFRHSLRFFFDRLGRALAFLWSGWAGLAALSLLAALWQFGHEVYGPFILSSPVATLVEIGNILCEPVSREQALLTLSRACAGFVIVSGLGLIFGIVAGYSPASMRIAYPLITVLMGVPPIAWIVLGMIWFGNSGATVQMVILLAALPTVFIGMAQGILTRDRALEDMAKSFGAGPFARFWTIAIRQATTTLFPALALALGTSFKVAVMAELLANAGGIGGALADARINLDIARALAWVVISVTLLILIEYTLVQPIKGEFDHWRRAAKPWGVKI